MQSPIVIPQQGMNPVVPQMQQDVLSRWPWVKRSIVEDIANGQFDIYDLPKLHRDETLRNRHIVKSVEGITLPFSGGRPQIIQARTKIQASFKDLQTFLAAWMVYTGIRLCYAPERGPGFQMFAEHLASFCLMSYDFSTTLDYAIAFFQKHQNSSLEAWFEVDGYLHTTHFGNATQRAVIAAAARAASPTKTSQKTLSSSTVPISEQVCHNYNRPTGCKFDDNDCLRLHICSLCRGEHTQLTCPRIPIAVERRPPFSYKLPIGFAFGFFPPQFNLALSASLRPCRIPLLALHASLALSASLRPCRIPVGALRVFLPPCRTPVGASAHLWHPCRIPCWCTTHLYVHMVKENALFGSRSRRTFSSTSSPSSARLRWPQLACSTMHWIHQQSSSRRLGHPPSFKFAFTCPTLPPLLWAVVSDTSIVATTLGT